MRFVCDYFNSISLIPVLLLASGELCRILIRPSNIGYSFRFIERHHWVCRSWSSSWSQRVVDLPYSAILASYLLEEELGHLGRLGCTICLLGSLIIVLHAPADKDIQTVDEVLRYAIQPGTSSLLARHTTPLTGAQAS